MNSKKQQILLFYALIVFLICLTLAFSPRKHRKFTAPSRSHIVITSLSMGTDFATNPSFAQSKYSNKTITISGKVISGRVGFDPPDAISLDGGGAPINIYVNGDYAAEGRPPPGINIVAECQSMTLILSVPSLQNCIMQ